MTGPVNAIYTAPSFCKWGTAARMRHTIAHMVVNISQIGLHAECQKNTRWCYLAELHLEFAMAWNPHSPFRSQYHQVFRRVSDVI